MLYLIHLYSQSFQPSSKLGAFIICITYLLVGVSGFVLGIRITNDLSYKDPSWFFRRYVAEARYAMSLSRSGNILRSTPPALQDVTLWDQIAVGFIFVENYFRSIVGLYWDPLILMCCMTLWGPVRGFYDEVLKDITILSENQDKMLTSLRVQFILEQYKELKKLAQLVNEAIGQILLSSVLETMIYCSIHINAVFISTDWFRQLRSTILFAGTISIFVIASEINKMVTCQNMVFIYILCHQQKRFY